MKVFLFLLFSLILFFDLKLSFLLLLLVVLYIKNFFIYSSAILENLNIFLFILVLMSLFILSNIFLSELNFNLKILSFFLVMVSFFFFFSINFFYIYLFFEFSLFPIMVMILGYGYQIEKINSSYYLLFFTLIFSMPFFFFFFNLDLNINLMFFNLFFNWEIILILSLMFMLKFPVYFLHFWLPKAHVEAPTSASMLLAGLLLKLGTGGFLRLMKIFVFFNLNFYLLLSFIGMIFSSFICIFQSDLKSLAAYSSINHMSLVLLSLILVNSFSIINSVLVMLSHGFISVLMFYYIGEFYHFSQTRLVYYYSSLFSFSVSFAVFITFVWLYNSGVPLSLTFFAEFNIFLSVLNFNIFYWFLLFLYFFLTFYYCLFFISLNFLGKMFLYLNFNLNFFSFYFIFLNSNIFFLMFFI